MAVSVYLLSQGAKKVVSDSPGLVDFAIGVVNSVLYQIHFEITGYPCNVIGSQWCDLFTNRTIFCFKLASFSQPMKMGQ